MNIPKDISYYKNRKIKLLAMEAGDTYAEVGRYGVEEIVLSSEHYGDHAENWCVCFDAQGREMRRYKASSMAIIEWELETTNNPTEPKLG